MTVGSPLPTVERVAKELLTLAGHDAVADLANEDPITAAEVHFSPLRVRSLPATASAFTDECSTDGFYEATIDPDHPWILYNSEVSERRVRFTIAHEIGHHLLATVAAHLIDPIDRIGHRTAGGGAQQTEERVCHAFAGRVIISDQILEEALASASQLLPAHVELVHERTNASWEATAVRLAGAAPQPCAVVLMREPGIVWFCAASAGLEGPWWPRGSVLAHGSPLASAFDRDRTSVRDTYRAGLSYAEQLFVDIRAVQPGRLTVAVMSRRRSDGRFDILGPVDPIWKERELFCEWCNEERAPTDRGDDRERRHGDDRNKLDNEWCDRCRGPRCRSCGRCGCERPLPTPLCPGCGMPEPPNPGHRFCRSCVLDGRAEA